MYYMIPVPSAEASASSESLPVAPAGYSQPLMPFFPYNEGLGAVPMMMTSEGVLVPAPNVPMEGATRRESERGERA